MVLSGVLTTSGGTELAGREAGPEYLATGVGFVKLSPCRKPRIAAEEITFMMLQLSILFIPYYVQLCFSHVQQVFLPFPVIFLFVFLSFCKQG